MADNLNPGPANDAVPPAQPGGGGVLPAVRDGRDPHPQPAAEILRQIPVVLETPELIQGHNNYKEVLVAFYALLETEDRGNPPVRYVRTNYLTCDAATWDAFKGANQYLSNMEQNIPCLYKVLTLLLSPPRGQQTTPLCNQLNDGDVNAVLANQQHNFQATAASFKLDVLKLWIQNVRNSVHYVHRKAKTGVFLYTRVTKLEVLVRELRNNYQRLLASLCNRRECNDLAIFVAEQLQFAIDESREYSSLKEDRYVMDALLFLERYTRTNVFRLQGGANSLQDVATRNAWYGVHHFQENFDPLTAAPLEAYSKSLEPILQGIRSFQPSAREVAEDQARNLRPSATALGRDITNFLALEDSSKSLGAAKSLRSSLSNMRTMLEALVPQGIILDTTTTGLTAIEISNFSSELDDFISQKESQIRREENKS